MLSGYINLIIVKRKDKVSFYNYDLFQSLKLSVMSKGAKLPWTICLGYDILAFSFEDHFLVILYQIP